MVSLGRTGTGRCFIEVDVTSLRFAIIGAGRLGATLGLALRAKGMPLAGYTAGTSAGRARAEAWLSGSAAADLQGLAALKPDLYLIAVPDAALPEVSAQLADLLEPDAPAFVAHTSGATSTGVLQACAGAGATTFAFHPLQTFTDPTTGGSRFEGAALAVTPGDGGPDSIAAVVGFELARLLGARPFFLPDANRTLYHAAAATACNYLVTLEHIAERLFVRSGLPEQDAVALFIPLVRATLENVESEGTVAALTGPLSRGDTDTVSEHLAALSQKADDLLPVYKELGKATLEIVRARGEVDDETIREMARLLSRPPGNLTDNQD